MIIGLWTGAEEFPVGNRRTPYVQTMADGIDPEAILYGALPSPTPQAVDVDRRAREIRGRLIGAYLLAGLGRRSDDNCRVPRSSAIRYSWRKPSRPDA